MFVEKEVIIMAVTSKYRRILTVLLMLAIFCSMMPAMGIPAHAAVKKQKTTVKSPQNLKIKKNKSELTISVSWKTQKKADRVQIQLKKGKAKYKTVKVTSKKSAVLKGFKTGKDYRLRIRAVRTVKKPGKKTVIYSAFTAYKKIIRFKESASSGTKDNSSTDPNSPAKPEEGENSGTSSGSSSGTSGGLSSGTAENPSGNTDVQRADILNNEKTKLQDLGFAQYVVISFQSGYNLSNTKIIVDGSDVSDAATPVTDDGSVAKWEITSLNPAEITAVSEEDPSKKESVKISDNKSPEKPVVRKHTSADYMIAHGPVSTFDFYLTNYDDNGSIRVEPSKTTFGADNAVPAETVKYFVSEAELKNDGTGKIVILFNYSTEKDKTWFDGIAETGSLALAENNENRTTLNDHLKYSKSTEDHYGKKVGAITINLPQSNFETNGRYLIRIKSSGRQTCLASVNLVNEQKPTIKISENGPIESGQNIHFHISNMVAGLNDPVERVILTNPKGESKELDNVNDYFLYGSTGLFVLYNDVKAENGTNHTEYSGKYTLTIDAAGFKTIKKSFEVVGGKYAGGKRGASRYKVDAVTRATSIGGGSSSGSSGSSSITNVSADLKFNTDLLVNALIMDKISQNKAAKAIADRWLTQVVADYACTADGKKFADWTDYYNAVQNAKEEGKYLSYADYLSSGISSLSESRPSKVKAVLEDNLLGDIDETYLGLKAPELSISENVKEGQDAVFTCRDKDYLKAISFVHEKGNYYPLSRDKYSVELKKGTFTIKASALSLDPVGNVKDNAFTVKAEGYKEQTVHAAYEKTLEKVSLTLKNEGMKAGNDAVISVGNSSGDFLKNLAAVKLVYNGSEKTLYTQTAGGTSGNDWYEISDDSKTLTIKGGAFKAEGTYTLKLKASHYDEKQITFQVDEKEDAPDASEVPALKSVTKSGSSMSIKFNGMDDAVAEYLDKLTSVKVGNMQYQKGLLGVSDRQYIAVNDPVYGGKRSILELSASGFSTDSDTTVELKADGYKTLTFVIDKNGHLKTAGAEETAGKKMTVVPELYFDQNQHYLQLKSYNQDFLTWLKKIQSVSVNDAELKPDKNTWSANACGVSDSYVAGESSLALTSDTLKTGGNTVKIKADGYEEVTLKITRTKGDGWFTPDTFAIEK